MAHTIFSAVRSMRRGEDIRGLHFTEKFIRQAERDKDDLTAKQREFVTLLRGRWERQERGQVLRQLESVEEYFDPESSASLVSFVGCGGVDMFVKILIDDATWMLQKNYHRDDIRAVRAYNTVVRVLTEVLVVDKNTAWYIHDNYPELYHRLVAFAGIPKFQESSIMLLEHIISAVGPVMDINRMAGLQKLLTEADDGTLAAMCRVVALLIVSGSLSEQSTCLRRLEPFPQCITRLDRIDKIISSNISCVFALPQIIDKLLTLSEVTSDGVRIFHGNRTMTVMAPDEASHGMPMVNFGDGEGMEDDQFSIEDFMMQLQYIQNSNPNANALFSAAGAANVTGNGANGGGASGPNVLQTLQNWFSGIGGGLGMDADETDDPADSPSPMPSPVSAAAQPQPQSLPAIQPTGWSGIVQATNGSLNPVPVAVPVQVPPANSGGTSPGGPGSTPEPSPPGAQGEGADSQSPQQTLLQQVASSIGNDMPAANALDSIEFTWYLGAPDGKARWRLRDMLITDESDRRHEKAPKFQTRSDINMSQNAFLASVRTTMRTMRKSKQQEERMQRQGIVNAQSEVLFVLNTLLNSQQFPAVWEALSRNSALERFNEMLNQMFFIGCAPTSLNVDGDSTAQRTPAPRNSDTAGLDDVDVMEELQDKEDPNHRHDPDTLRKIELLRCIHEYWNAQDRFEMAALFKQPTVVAIRLELAGKICDQLIAGKEDPCTETLAAHSIESFLRSVPHGKARIDAAGLVHRKLTLHILKRRIHELTADMGVYNSLFPLKRTESFLTVVGESARYYEPALSQLEDVFSGKIKFGPEGNCPEDGFTIPEGAPAPAARNKPFVDILEKISRSFPFDINLFLRGPVVTTLSGLRSWKNVLRAPTKATIADGSWATQPDLITKLPQFLRRSETTTVQLKRLYEVRRLSAEFVDSLYDAVAVERSDPALLGKSVAGHAAVMDMRPMFDQLESCTGLLPRADRSFPQVFLEEELRIVSGDSADAGVLDHRLQTVKSRAELEQYCFPAINEDAPEWSCAPTPGYFFDGVNCPAIKAFLDRNVASIVLHTSSDINAHEMESTEKLCAITTIIMLFLRQYAIHGEQGIVDILDRVKALHHDLESDVLSSTKRKRGKKGVCHEHPQETDPLIVSWACAGCTLFDERYRSDNPFLEAFQLNGQDPENPHGRLAHDPEAAKNTAFCPFVNLFRLLCIWVAHYTCSQRYLETLFYCSQIPIYEYKQVVALIWRHLPRYFRFAADKQSSPLA